MAEFDLEKAVGDILAEYSADVSKAAETAITAVAETVRTSQNGQICQRMD